MTSVSRCCGQVLNCIDYPQLFSKISSNSTSNIATGDGYTTFQLPALGWNTGIVTGATAITSDKSFTFMESNMIIGGSLAISADGLTLAVGDPYAQNTAGTVTVYARTCHDSPWVADPILKDASPASLAAQTFYGHHLALSDDGMTLAVGANNLTLSVYQKSLQGGWSNTATLITLAGTSPDVSHAVATSSNGSRVAVSIPGNEVGYYDFINGTWQKGGQFTIPPGTNPRFGSSLAMSGDGNTIAVGQSGMLKATANYERTPKASNNTSGKVFLYKYDMPSHVEHLRR